MNQAAAVTDADPTSALLEEVARSCRVANRLGLLDLMGHVSARLGPDRIVSTPAFGIGAPLPRSVHAEDLIVVDLDGERLQGEGAVPFDLELDLAIYRARPTAGAVIVGAAETALAFGIAGAEILPLTHSQARIAYQGGIATIRPAHLPTTRDRAEAIVRDLADGLVLQLAGLAVVAVGTTVLDAIERLEGVEYLARLTLLARRLTDEPRRVTADESAGVIAERPSEKIPSRDPRRFYDALDPLLTDDGAPSRVSHTDTTPTDDPEELRRRIALCCRILAAQGTLAAFKEHVSHRVATNDRYLMSPAKLFSTMEPGDIGEVGTEGDCAWLSGPYPPAPFRWYHRDLLQARPDVNAVVHTHELYGRAIPMAGHENEPFFRNGAALANVELPVFPVPSLVFRQDYRDETIRLLDAGPAVHLLSHGTDFVGRTLEEATMAAIHREQLCRLQIMATELGTPRPLARSVVEELVAVMPAPGAWWEYYAADVPGFDGPATGAGVR